MLKLHIQALRADEIYPVRQVVLRPGQSLESAIFPGDDHPHAFHLGAYLEGQLIGVGTVFPAEPDGEMPDPAWRMRGMAVLPEHQKSGAGMAIVQGLIEHVATQGGACVWGWARASAMQFYEKGDFVVLGDVVEFPEIGFHYKMARYFESPQSTENA